MLTNRAGLVRIVGEMKIDLSKLEKSHADLYASAQKLAKLYDSLSKKVEAVGRVAQGGNRPAARIQRAPTLSPTSKAISGGDTQAQLMMATREMQEMNMSFNLQYLQLQQKMQSDNRQFTLLSNIMKTKHDTAKNAINNVR